MADYWAEYARARRRQWQQTKGRAPVRTTNWNLGYRARPSAQSGIQGYRDPASYAGVGAGIYPFGNNSTLATRFYQLIGEQIMGGTTDYGAAIEQVVAIMADDPRRANLQARNLSKNPWETLHIRWNAGGPLEAPRGTMASPQGWEQFLQGSTDEMSLKEAMERFTSMDRGMYDMLLGQLVAAGFFPEGSQPTFGDRNDPNNKAAFQEALLQLLARGNDLSLDEFLGMRAQGIAEGGMGQLPTQVFELTDELSIKMVSDELAQQFLGRKLTDAEKATFVDMIHDRQRQEGYSDASTATLLAAEEAGIITGATVAAQGQQLAQQYGLTMSSNGRSVSENNAVGGAENSSHLYSNGAMAADLSGSVANMDRLYSWAKSQEGPGKLFRQVLYKYEDPGGHSDHVHLDWNRNMAQGVFGPGQAPTGSTTAGYMPQLGGGDLQAFMNAVASVESQGSGGYDAYNSSSGAFGRYQFMPTTYAGAARMAGISPSDRSPAAQDAAARALMQNYYAKYGDWQLVAIAWHAGPASADAVASGQVSASAFNDGNISTAQYVERVMAAMGAPNLAGLEPNILFEEGYDWERHLQEEIKKRFPHEYESHEMDAVMRTMQGIFGGAVAGGI